VNSLEDKKMNAVDLLIEDHERLKDILTRLTESTERAVKTRTELLQKLEMEVTIHTQLEEQVLYPAFKEAGGKDELKMYHEAKEEHRAVDSLVLPDLKKTDPGSVEFSGRIKVCKELLEHHIEEEESEMFPDVRELFDAARLEELGKQMAELRNRLKKDFASRQAA
jgi:hemerythrin superfamily protein